MRFWDPGVQSRYTDPGHAEAVWTSLTWATYDRTTNTHHSWKITVTSVLTWLAGESPVKKEPCTENLSSLSRHSPLFMVLGSLYGPGASRFEPQSHVHTVGHSNAYTNACLQLVLFVYLVRNTSQITSICAKLYLVVWLCFRSFLPFRVHAWKGEGRESAPPCPSMSKRGKAKSGR